MKEKSFLIKTVFFIIFIISLSVLAVNLPILKVFSISNRKVSDNCYYISAKKISGFEISYTHSVNKGRVHDFYTIQPDDSLLLDKTLFVSYGAGIPEPEETPGADFLVTDDGYMISNLHRKVEKLTMAVGLIANHAIALYDSQKGRNKEKSIQEYYLTDLFEPQTSIILEIKRITFLKYIFHKLNKKGGKLKNE